MDTCHSRCRRGWHCGSATSERYNTEHVLPGITEFTFCCSVLGAKVIAAAGSDEKLSIAKRYGGADFTVNYSTPGWQKEVLKLTDGKGVDVIYDPVGLIKGTALKQKQSVCQRELLRLSEMYRLEGASVGDRLCGW